MAKRVAVKEAAVRIYNLNGAVSQDQEVELPIVITLPGNIAKVAGLEDGYELTVTVGRENIERFLEGEETEDEDGNPANYQDADTGSGAILLTF